MSVQPQSSNMSNDTLEMVLARARAARSTREVFVVTLGDEYVTSDSPPTWGAFENATRHYTMADARSFRARFTEALRSSAKASTYVRARGSTLGIERHTIEVIEVEIVQ